MRPLNLCSVGYETRICCCAGENHPKYNSVCSGNGVGGGAGGRGDFARFVRVLSSLSLYSVIYLCQLFD